MTGNTDVATSDPLGTLCPDCHGRRHRFVVRWLSGQGVTFTKETLVVSSSCVSCRCPLPAGNAVVSVGYSGPQAADDPVGD